MNTKKFQNDFVHVKICMMFVNYLSLFMPTPRRENSHTINDIYFDKRVQEIKDFALNSKNMAN